MSERFPPRKNTSGTRAVDAPLLAGTIPGTRRPHLEDREDVVIDGRRLTHGGGWLSLHTESMRVHAAFRDVEVHVRLVFHESPENQPPTADVFVDRVRVSDIEWRSVSAFLADGAEAWASCLLEEIRRAFGLALADAPAAATKRG